MGEMVNSNYRFETLYALLTKVHTHSIRASVAVLHHLCVDEKPDYQKLAEVLERGYKEEEKAIVKLQEYLKPHLKCDCILRDYLIKGYLLNAAHELERLHIIETTGKDPDVIEEPIVSCENCEVKTVKRIRNS